MAADIGADMHRPDLALRELYRGKYRALRTAGAEIRRPRRDVADSGGDRGLVRHHGADTRGDRLGVDAVRPRLGKESRDAA